MLRVLMHTVEESLDCLPGGRCKARLWAFGSAKIWPVDVGLLGGRGSVSKLWCI